ncbi:MAG TPA: glycine oxidase ThiO [Stellaceae bacterium]|nr:glycine oxidase ThiO [Stellaceae bacterium]
MSSDASSRSITRGDRPRIAIIGGGAVGLGIGWRLAAAGCAVDVFERGAAGHGASWAAAGMLAAGIEAEPGEIPLLALNRESQRRWPGFAAELRDASGIDVELRTEGTLELALTGDDLRQLRFSYEFQRGLGIELEWLTPAAARKREPHLGASLAGAVLSAGDHQVNNRRLVEALAVAFTHAGGRLHENSAVTALETAGGRVSGVRLADGGHAADIVVLAAGAWSRAIPGIPPEALPPIRPVKGQLIALRMEKTAPLVSHVIWAPGVYLVPRRDGRLILGATVEERGFDETLTAGGALSLLEAAWRALPAIDELPIDEMWVGFRPGSPDDAPVLGPSPVDGLVLATGHHRNGILLTPVTADEVSRAVLTGEAGPVIRPFSITRFHTQARQSDDHRAAQR